MTPTLEELAQRLDRAEGQLRETKHQLTRASRRARVASAVAALALGASLLLNVRPAALATVMGSSPGVSLATLVARISALEQKTAALTQTGTPGTYPATLTIKGVNVQIVDGNPYHFTDDGTQGETQNTTLTGLGNLIIGYNRSKGSFGSHNLIVGDTNNYSSFGCLVAGFGNSVFGPYSSVTGGYHNQATNTYASVTGGDNNEASGQESSVSGGVSNTASLFGASVSGGFSNMASGGEASVSGGQNLTVNTASGWAAGSLSSNGTVSGNFTSP